MRGAPREAVAASPHRCAAAPGSGRSPAPTCVAVGRQLGLTLDEMIERTRIRVLDHIESERFELLPPEPYLRGYLLSYAQELGVSEFARLVASYLARLPRVEALPGAAVLRRARA